MNTESVNEYGYKMGPAGVGPSRVVCAVGPWDKIARDMKEKGVSEGGICALEQGGSIIVDSHPTPFGDCVETSLISKSACFPNRLQFGDVIEHPLLPDVITVFLRSFGDDLRRDRVTVSDARFNTRNWSAEQLERLYEMVELHYPGERLFQVEL